MILAEAQKYCEDRNHKFTTPRQMVLAAIENAGRPVGAYDIIAALPPATKPPTVYRALEFWQREGFIHRIATLNAYNLCRAGHRHRGAQYMVCDSCGGIDEIHLCHLPQAIQDSVTASGFTPVYWNAEIHGTCVRCRPQDQAGGFCSP